MSRGGKGALQGTLLLLISALFWDPVSSPASACSPAPGLPRVLANAIRLRQFITIYGPPATGKTRVAFEIAKEVLAEGRDVEVIATESGTVTYARSVVTCVPTKLALSVDQLLDLMIDGVSQGRYIVVDSINWPFRSQRPSPAGLSILSLISALLRGSGGVAIGQVSEVDEGISMALGEWVLPWSHVIGVTGRVQCHGICSEMQILKPRREVVRYELVRDGVRWTGEELLRDC